MGYMKLTSAYLEGFLAICRQGNLTAAAKHLGLTQPALSLRLKNLEDILEETVLIRQKDGVVLTEAGHRLLEHAEFVEGLEKECLADLRDEGKISGTLRIGSFSTIGRSLVFPALVPMLKNFPEMGLHFSVKELRELPALLHSGELDIIFLDRELAREGVESIFLGHEEYVFITSKQEENVPEIYLNHDEDDLMSFRYWESVGEPRVHLNRRYLDEIYNVIEGVADGVGVSVLPRHLIKNDSRIKVLNPKRVFPSPVYMISKKRAWRPRHLQLAMESLEQGLKMNLK